MIGKAQEPSEACTVIILASEDVGIRVWMELCQIILDENASRLGYQCCNLCS